MSADTAPATDDRARRARVEPLSAERIAPGLFEVQNRRSNRHYRVDVREPACECADFQYTMGPVDGACKHIAFIQQIGDGRLCPHCGYTQCRPSCPRRGERCH